MKLLAGVCGHKLTQHFSGLPCPSFNCTTNLASLQVVGLMSDTALLAVLLAVAEQQQQQQSQAGSPANLSSDAISAAAARLLESWLPAAQAAVLGSGLLSAEALATLLSQWDWQPVLQQAAVQMLQSKGALNGSSSHAANARRAMQRSVRMLADLVRRQPRHI